MSTFGQEVAAAKAAMELAISDALQNEVAEVVKKAIVESARENVYEAYDPVFLSRNAENGGLLDEGNLAVSVTGTELTVENLTPFQHLWGGQYPSETLTDVIESGDSRFHMGSAGARPFMEPAKQAVISGGEAVDALRRGLQRQGIDTTGMTFNFE